MASSSSTSRLWQTLSDVFEEDEEPRASRPARGLPRVKEESMEVKCESVEGCDASSMQRPMRDWVSMINAAYQEMREEAGRQTKPFQMRSACSGTGAAKLAMEARASIIESSGRQNTICPHSECLFVMECLVFLKV